MLCIVLYVCVLCVCVCVCMCVYVCYVLRVIYHSPYQHLHSLHIYNHPHPPSPIPSQMVAPVNKQDVSGLHHMIPRTFGERTQLDQLHFMDPEDLLMIEEGVKEEEIEENRLFLEKLENASISYRYERLEVIDFDADADDEEDEDKYLYDDDVEGKDKKDKKEKKNMGKAWNKVMGHYQSVLRKNQGIEPRY